MTETANCFLPAPKILPHHSRLAAQRMSCLILLLLLLLYTMREYSRPSVVRNNNITHNCFFHFPCFQHYCPRAQVPAVYELIFVGMITCLRLFVFAGDTVRRRLRPHTPRPRVITNTISSCCRWYCHIAAFAVLAHLYDNNMPLLWCTYVYNINIIKTVLLYKCVYTSTTRMVCANRNITGYDM